MSMVGHFEAAKFESGELVVLKSFTCDVPDLTRAIEDEAAADDDIDWIAGYDPDDEEPTPEHLTSPDVILAAVARVQAKHGDDSTFAHDIEGVQELCQFAGREDVKILLSYV